MDIPEPSYAKTGYDVHIAYQVVGDGPIDIAWQLDLRHPQAVSLWQTDSLEGHPAIRDQH